MGPQRFNFTYKCLQILYFWWENLSFQIYMGQWAVVLCHVAAGL